MFAVQKLDMEGLFRKAIEENEEVLEQNIDANNGLWTALLARKVLSEKQLASCKNRVRESLFV